MDVLAVATTVCALCRAIETWIDQVAQKELLLGQISSNVAQIRNILSPFASEQYSGKGEITRTKPQICHHCLLVQAFLRTQRNPGEAMDMTQNRREYYGWRGSQCARRLGHQRGRIIQYPGPIP
ncbi:hypothetical protein GALMADRAFT_255804 [Galerina marginata CBS 339.88]|uniref:Saposin B-type domain-containing protein n=1 Tax=Galerina marginata (strain CBS 339.88) TaxID=685588 RepID=A0A067SPI0_GALM3|nr:hypothetical protein GALMADRAFT_255804 [Galerina marginata CBS 339.88]